MDTQSTVTGRCHADWQGPANYGPDNTEPPDDCLVLRCDGVTEPEKIRCIGSRTNKRLHTAMTSEITGRPLRVYWDSVAGPLYSSSGQVVWTQNGAPEKANRADDSQPMPMVNESQNIQDQVIADIEARKEVGLKRYGTLLQAFNGRDALQDAYEEVLDLCVYLKQVIVERDANKQT